MQDCSNFVDDDLHSDQQPVVPPLRGDVTFDPVVGEACEGERAVGSYIVA